MKKIVFTFWGINLLTSIVLFVIYRIVISQTALIDGNSFEKWIQILELVLNIGFSFTYLVAMVISSFAIFLNLKEKIRNSFYLSLLTFLGIPLLCAIIIWIDIQLKEINLFSAIYVLLVTVEYLIFRKRVEIYNLNQKITAN